MLCYLYRFYFLFIKLVRLLISCEDWRKFALFYNLEKLSIFILNKHIRL
jgi:hypothetical protein